MRRKAVAPAALAPSKWSVSALLAGVLLAACTGSVGQSGRAGDDGDGGGAGDDGSGGVGGSLFGGSGGGPPPPPGGLKIRNDSLGISCDPKGAGIGSSPLVRLTSAEYNNTLSDLFKGMFTVPKQDLPPEVIFDGFNNNAAGQSASAVLIENYEAAAGNLANLAVDKVFSCAPTSTADETACLDGFLNGFAKKIFRRPLTDDEKTAFRSFVTDTRKTDDWKTTARLLVQGMLQSPQFLYRVEYGTGTAAAAPLTGYELASRMSYLLWDSMPDDALFAAAESGDLSKPEGIRAQLDRMMGDARAKTAVADFMGQWLDLARFDKHLGTKSTTLFPKYTAATATGLRDGVKKFLDYVYWEKGGSLNALLTDTRAYVNDATAWIYGVSSTTKAPALSSVDLDGSRRRGFLTQAGVLSGLGHETLQAPILRGIFVLDRILCAPPPPPPANVMAQNPEPKQGDTTTLRQRIELQHEQGNCRDCHKYIDGAGFAFDSFDAVGQWRDKEEGQALNTKADIVMTYDMDGSYDGYQPLIDKLAQSEQVAECAVAQWYRYAVARSLEDADACSIARMTNEMLENKGDMRALLYSIVTSDTFRARTR